MAIISNLALASLGLILLFNFAAAQDASSTTEAVVSSTTEAAIHDILSCQNATAKTVNATLLLGQWYEVARKTYPNAAFDEHNKAQCVSMKFYIPSNSSLSTLVTYSTNPEKLWSNKTIDYNLAINVTSKLVEGVYNITTSSGVIKTYKIVETDYDKYAFVCGYEVAFETPAPSTTEAPSSTTISSSTTAEASSTTDASTTTIAPKPVLSNVTEAYILIRNRSLSNNGTVLSNLLYEASSEFLDFKNLTLVVQSDKCENGAAALVPMLTLMLAVVLAIIKA
ncbi:uncharacterized protein LOC129918589 [Episyrphus balteatus]|uniref:uncharacterized protein LOC129918589 n=1 Tax=Episyrphus balteatus TaxID=286459 RepID=UPI002485BBE7|nr:uncharacterized protein LOC129918589 [Episyrphus balteatus]